MLAASSEYQVIYSGQIKAKLKDLLNQAKKAGKLSRFVAAAMKMDERLRSDPLNFGELIGNLRWKKMPLHVGFARPLKVDFAILEAERMVFVRKIETVTSLDAPRGP